MDLRVGTLQFADDDLVVVAIGPVGDGGAYEIADVGDAPASAIAARVAGATVCCTRNGAENTAEVVAAGADLLITGDRAAIGVAARADVTVACPPAALDWARMLVSDPARLVLHARGGQSAANVRDLVGTGVPVLVDVDEQDGDLDGALAVACVHAWLGVRLFRTAHPARLRDALDMTAAIRGTRPPVAPRRALA